MIVSSILDIKSRQDGVIIRSPDPAFTLKSSARLVGVVHSLYTVLQSY